MYGDNDIRDSPGQLTEQQKSSAATGPSTNEHRAISRWQFRADQVQMLYQQVQLELTISILFSVIVTTVLWNSVPHSHLIGWACVVIVSVGMRILFISGKSADSNKDRVNVWGQHYITGVTISGMCWGSLGIITSIHANLTQQLFVLVVLAGISVTAYVSMQSSPRTVSAFVIPADTPGITRTRFDDFGSESVGRGSLFFDNVAVPAENRLGDEGGGFYQVMQGFDYSRALIGLQCCALAQASLDETWQWVQERETFGRPLAQYQGVTFPLAEGETLIHAARLLCYETLWLRDQGRPHTDKAAMCKWFAPKTAADVIHNCLLAHGHAGYSKDSPHQQRLRDVIGLEIGDGTAQISKLIIAREKIGNVAVQYR